MTSSVQRNSPGKMVCEWGMSEALGPLTFGKKEEEIFLGREFATHRDYSEEVAMTIDKEVRHLIVQSYERTRRTLKEHMAALIALAQALLEKEVLNGHEIDQILKEAIPQWAPS